MIQAARQNHPAKSCRRAHFIGRSAAIKPPPANPSTRSNWKQLPRMTRGPEIDTSPLPSRHARLIHALVEHRVGPGAAGEALVAGGPWDADRRGPGPARCQELLEGAQARRPRFWKREVGIGSRRPLVEGTRPLTQVSEQGQAQQLARARARLAGALFPAGNLQQRSAPCSEPMREEPGCLSPTPELTVLAPPAKPGARQLGPARRSA